MKGKRFILLNIAISQPTRSRTYVNVLYKSKKTVSLWLQEKPQIFTKKKKVRSIRLQNTGKGKFWLQKTVEIADKCKP